jgi:hypothetical protein
MAYTQSTPQFEYAYLNDDTDFVVAREVADGFVILESETEVLPLSREEAVAFAKFVMKLERQRKKALACG